MPGAGIALSLCRHPEGGKVRPRGTVAHFARQAMREYSIDEAHAKSAVSILLRAIEGVLAEWRLRPTAPRAALLEDTYVTIAVDAVERLARVRDM